jgi:hypothetical protein
VTGFALVAAVIAIFFAAGIAVGMLLTVAFPQFRRYRQNRKSMNSADWREPSALDEDKMPPRWPGG